MKLLWTSCSYGSLSAAFLYPLDQGNEYGALITDLSKAFDCLPYDLIVAKLHAYGFSIESLKLINSYLRVTLYCETFAKLNLIKPKFWNKSCKSVAV